MTAKQKLLTLLKGEKTDSPVVFGEIRHVDFINRITGGDIKAADDEEKLYLTVTAYVKAGVTICRSLMLPKWGLYKDVVWDGYLNWKANGEQQYTYDESLKILRDMADKRGIFSSDAVIRKAEWLADYRKKAQKIMGDDMLYIPDITHFCLEGTYHTLGLTNFSYIMADDPKLVDAALEANFLSAQTIMEIMVKQDSSLLVHLADDLGMKNTTILPPDWLREFYFPKLKKLIGSAHAIGLKFFFHSCGNVNEVLEDIIDAGADMMEPLELTSGMNLKEVSARVGDRLILCGNQDLNMLGMGTPDEVRSNTLRLLREGGSRYMIPAYFSQNADVENVYAWMDAVKNYK